MSGTVEQANAAGKAEQNVAQHSYPEDLGDVFMRMKFYDYDYSAARGFRNTKKLKASIQFPMPASVVDSSRLEVGGKQIGTLGGIASDIATGNASVGQFGRSIKDAVGKVAGAGEALGAATSKFDFTGMGEVISGMVKPVGNAGLYLLRAGVGSLAPTLEQGLSASVGTAVNPQATLVFDGVDLKIHNFEWQFAPKSQTEQQELDEIIRRIQFHIHPDYASPLGADTGLTSVNRGLLKYPSLMEIELVGVGGTFNLVFRPKHLMMVNQFNVDYTPTGNVELNRGGTPVMTRCSMNVSESTIRTRTDFSTSDLAQGSTGETDEDRNSDAAAPGDTVEGSNVVKPTASSAGDITGAENAIDTGNINIGP